MKNKLNIFSNNKMDSFLTSFLSKYKLQNLKLEDINYKTKSSEPNIIIINNDKDADLINFKNLNENYLVMSNLKNKNIINNKNFKFLNTPMSINNIKSNIENLLQNLKVCFHDIFIEDEKLKNLKTNYFCYLTKAELEILKFLIKEKETSKSFVKENILKIKSNIETNSLESHLTRIRKKMNKIDTNVKIKTKNEKLLITI